MSQGKRKQAKAVTPLNERIKIAADRIGGQSVLAERLGILPQALNALTSPTRARVPRADRLAKIAEATGVDPGWLLTGHGEPDPPARVGTAEADEALRESHAAALDAVRALGRLLTSLEEVLPAAERRELHALVRSLLDGASQS